MKGVGNETSITLLLLAAYKLSDPWDNCVMFKYIGAACNSLEPYERKTRKRKWGENERSGRK